MAGYNTAICLESAAYTGSPDCPVKPGKIKGAFIVKASFELAAADLLTDADVVDALEAAIVAPLASRIFPLPKFEGITDNTSDPTTSTSGYGDIAVVGEGDINWVFNLSNASLCVNNQMRKFNGKPYSVLFVDENGTIFGTKNATGDGIKGIPLKYFYAFPWKAADGSNNALFRAQFVFDPKYINEWVGFTQVAEPVLDLPGVQLIKLTIVSRATNVLQITMALSCGNIDLHDMFATELANAAVYRLTNATSGNVVTITSVASTATGWAITMDATDTPDYNTTANGMKLSLVSAASLATAGFKNFESNTVLTPAV